LTLTANLMLAEHVANGLPSHHVYIVSLVRAQALKGLRPYCFP